MKRPDKYAPSRTFTAELTSPDGHKETRAVRAISKADARRKIAAQYREDTPPPSAGFYSFGQQKLRWIEG